MNRATELHQLKEFAKAGGGKAESSFQVSEPAQQVDKGASDAEQSTAMQKLEKMASDLRTKLPHLSPQRAFSRVFTDPNNAALAAKAHVRPSATSSGYPFPK
jgi:hypothetical protein